MTANPSKDTARGPGTGAGAVERAGRRALGLVMVGLGLQIGALLAWSPATFIASAAVGVPLVVLGAGLFARAVWRALPDDPAGLQKGPPS